MEENSFVEQLDRIERNTKLAAKNVLDIEDVSVLTGLSKSYIYKLTCRREIPYYKPNGKLCYFDRKEIEDWQRQNRVITSAEAENLAARHIIKKGA